jgi:hypothetical protein
MREVMHGPKKHPLTGPVHADEFMTGAYEEGKQGRSTDGKKRLAAVASEISDDGAGRAYAQQTEHASEDEFKPFFNDRIGRDASVVTDERKGNLPPKSEYPFSEQKPSENAANFPEIRIRITNIQGRIRGIRHSCSKEHPQGYPDEYRYRYNRRYNTDTIFDNPIKKKRSNLIQT